MELIRKGEMDKLVLTISNKVRRHRPPMDHAKLYSAVAQILASSIQNHQPVEIFTFEMNGLSEEALR